jgi:hypothetical protein
VDVVYFVVDRFLKGIKLMLEVKRIAKVDDVIVVDRAREETGG